MDNCNTHSAVTSLGQKPGVISLSAENMGGLGRPNAAAQTRSTVPLFQTAWRDGTGLRRHLAPQFLPRPWWAWARLG